METSLLPFGAKGYRNSVWKAYKMCIEYFGDLCYDKLDFLVGQEIEKIDEREIVCEVNQVKNPN